MKKLQVSWSALAIIAPAAIICAIFLGSIHGPTSALAKKGKGSVQIAFITNVTAPPHSGPAFNFQNLFLNITSVRINHKPKPTAKSTAVPAEGAGSWVTIPLPSGVGGVSQGNQGDLQIDAIAGQSQAQYYNTGYPKQKTYYTFEVSFDTNNPGFVVPDCPSGGPAEGCINYPIVFQNPGAQIAYVSSQGFQVNKGENTLLLIQLNVSIVSAPSAPGQPYTVDVSVAPATQTQRSTYLGVISGAVSNAGKALNKKKVRKLTVTAEQPGTGIVVASVPVQSNGNYQMYLPATPNGTMYDLYVSGGKMSYEAMRLPAPGLVAGQTLSGEDFNSVKPNQTLGTISGTITDGCSKGSTGVSGATLQLLIPPDTDLSAVCSDPTQSQLCVTVATATTNNVGGYPLPGTVRAPAAFQQIPVLPKDSNISSYTLEISASGYTTQLIGNVSPTSGKKSKAGGSCPGSSSKVGCDLSLDTGYVNGTVNLGVAPQNNENVLVQVFAELSGTSQLVSTLPTPQLIRGPNQTTNFTLNVPTGPPPGSNAGSLDLFAYAIDLYQGAADPYTGHSIIVQADVPFPAASCGTSSEQPFSENMECTGHGSIGGTVVNPDTGTTVALMKRDPIANADVIVETTPGGFPQPGGITPSNAYNFCAPPDDNYYVQRFEATSPALNLPPTPVPTGAPTAVGTMATPQATSTPCPSTCNFGKFGNPPTLMCPGICGATFGPAL